MATERGRISIPALRQDGERRQSFLPRDAVRFETMKPVRAFRDRIQRAFPAEYTSGSPGAVALTICGAEILRLVDIDEYIRRCERQVAGWHWLRSELEQARRSRSRSARATNTRLPSSGMLAW